MYQGEAVKLSFLGVEMPQDSLELSASSSLAQGFESQKLKTYAGLK